MGNRFRYRNSVAIKVGIFFASLLVCVVVLEIGLRLTGFAITASRQREFAPEIGPPQGRILTFGDSLTNGGNVKSHHSYPYFLYKLLEETGERAAVHNLGYCEDSTFGVAFKLKHYLQTRPAGELPSAIVVLVGAADLFNLPLIRAGNLKDDAFWRDVVPMKWFYSLRVYKVFRHIKTNLPIQKMAKDSKAWDLSSEEQLVLILDVYERHKKGSAPGIEPALTPDLVAELETVFGEDYRREESDFKEIGDFIEFLTGYANRMYATKHRYDELFALLLDIAVHFPENFWNDSIHDANYFLVQSYQVQSKFTAEDVLKVLEKSKAEHPALIENVHFQHFMKILTDRDEMDAFVDGKRMEAWNEIVRLSREKGIRVYLQNYPVAYKSANEMIATVAARYGLPLIDNQAYFAKLIAEDGRAEYLEDDDHLTPVGYEMIAKNVFITIRKTETPGLRP